MTKCSLIKILRDGWRRFRRADRGNVVVTFGLAFIPIAGLTGAAVDYSRASAIRTAMQAAADSTALAVSKTAASQTAAQVQSAASTYFSATFAKPDAKNLAVTAIYSSTNGSSLTVSASATVYTDFMGIMGIKQMPISVSSTTAWGNSRLRVALVLDNTGSMADSGKITALKTATNNLLTQLKSAATNNGDVYVSIIPFVKDINTDPVNYAANWIDWTDWEANNGTCSGKNNNGGNTQSSCNKTWTPANHNSWNGCITDRGNSNGPSSGNYDTNVAAPVTSNTATLFPAEQYDSCPQAVVGLNYNWSNMTTIVNNMSPNGNTNQAVGLAWGWLSLVGGGPFTVPAMDPHYQYSQVIILLTDGLNTQDRWYSNQALIDARQTLTCTNIRNAGITLYTIQVNTGGDPTSTLLQQCANPASNFFLLTSASQIITTFNQIGTNLSKLRVAK